MKTLTKKCRVCLWAGPDREEDLETEDSEAVVPADLLPGVLGRSGPDLAVKHPVCKAEYHALVFVKTEWGGYLACQDCGWTR